MAFPLSAGESFFLGRTREEVNLKGYGNPETGQSAGGLLGPYHC
jgi:hypothetical protein